MAATTTMSQRMRECLDECENCARVCAETMSYCLQMGGAHAAPQHIRLMLDCIDMCRTSASFLTRASAFHARTCAVCADVCDRCADDCAGFEDDRRMQACADACRRCARSCREMAHAPAA
ncbi:MAG TPA: four-helix bundle copper-binding protein [Dehalococcoidia bacterium]|nr:four-helix bundle copper-binding protein [Dehalococcoidia bacterium]